MRCSGIHVNYVGGRKIHGSAVAFDDRYLRPLAEIGGGSPREIFIGPLCREGRINPSITMA